MKMQVSLYALILAVVHISSSLPVSSDSIIESVIVETEENKEAKTSVDTVLLETDYALL